MDDQELRKLLEQLHTEIERTRSVDDKSKALLNDLVMDIRELLERSGGAPVQAGPTTVQRLEETIAHLEVTHPALARLLSDLLETLSNAGI